MEIRHLRYFLAVADARHFGAAARALHMSQPPLSKRIAEFEQHIGAPLFVRTTRRVELAPAGAALLPHARYAVQAFDAAAQAMRAFAQQQTTRRLRLSFPAETSREVLLSAVDALAAKDVAVDVSEATTSEQIALLASAEVDLAVLRYPFDARGLKSGPALRQTLGVLLHVTHPLAREKTLRLAQLQAWPLIIFPRAVAPGLYDHLLLLCRKGGYTPHRIVQGLRMTAGMLVAESAVAFFTRDGAQRLFGDVSDLRWKALVNTPLHWWTAVVARKDNPHAAIDYALALVTQLLQQHDGWRISTFPARNPGPCT